MRFVNALALSGLETLKHLQIFFVNFTVVNALAQAQKGTFKFDFELRNVKNNP